ncbi:MAG: nucleotidyltransferase domain-containing protein [Candidatus Kuenenia sp.]|nr:nucleotidyltransferase domain-containing protein [Candidatus Kuenenia hertensis]
MAKNKVKEVIKFLEKSLEESGLEVMKIVLFGSYARKESTGESDIDIVIVSKDFRKNDIFKRVELIKEAEIKTIKKFMIPLDIIMMTPEEFESKTSIISDYARNGEVVYG